LTALWNELVDEQNTYKLYILSAASGLVKSIYLYFIVVFARCLKIPVQYIASAGGLIQGQPDQTRFITRYRACCY